MTAAAEAASMILVFMASLFCKLTQFSADSGPAAGASPPFPQRDCKMLPECGGLEDILYFRRRWHK
jgi:hypothetical protein